MITFNIYPDTIITEVGEHGHLKLINKNEILIVRKDHKPIFLLRQDKSLKFYELDKITPYERKCIDIVYGQVLSNICDEINSFIILVSILNMIDYHKVLDITKFKDGELMVA